MLKPPNLFFGSQKKTSPTKLTKKAFTKEPKPSHTAGLEVCSKISSGLINPLASVSISSPTLGKRSTNFSHWAVGRVSGENTMNLEQVKLTYGDKVIDKLTWALGIKIDTFLHGRYQNPLQ